MVENHARYTGSERARELLDDWAASVDQFVKVMPDAYAAVVEDRLAEGEDIRVSPPPKPQAASLSTEGDD
jgi:glutamate synthase (NADPH/NADH) large chain